jgi:hypothetical protein
MQTFKEYYQGNQIMNANATSVRRGGKSIMRSGRKHENLTRKEYSHKCPHVRNLINGGASTINLLGQPLMNSLQTYDMEFEPGVVKGIGNSDVEIEMFENEEGQPQAILRKKINNDL